MNNLSKSVFQLLVFVALSSSVLLADDDQFKTGQEALQKGDYPAAINALKEAVKNNKKNGEAFLLLGKAYLMVDSTDLAIATLVQARELEPTNNAVFMLLGDTYAKQKIWAAAVEQYKKVTEADSTSYEGWAKQGYANRMYRKYQDAAVAYKHALALDTNSVSALHELSMLYSRAKQWENALPYARKLALLEPDSLVVQIEYATALCKTSRWKELIPVAEAVLHQDASQADLQACLAEAYNATGQTILVVQTYLHLKSDSLSFTDLLRFAKALKSLDSLALAEKIFLKAIKKDSARCEPYYDFGTLLMKLKKYPDAIRAFEHKIACDTSSGYRFACHLNIAMSLMQLQKFTEALEHIHKALDLRPENVQAWVTLAQDLGQLEKTTEEISAYKKVIDLGTNDLNDGKYPSQVCEAERMVGVRYLIAAVDASKDKEPVKEKYLASLEYLKKALPCNPKDCALLLWIAQANQNSNIKDEAKKYYHKVIDTCPKSKEAATAAEALKGLGDEIK